MSIKTTEDFIAECDLLLDDTDFERSWDFLERLREWVVAHDRFTPKQAAALDHVRATGVESAL